MTTRPPEHHANPNIQAHLAAPRPEEHPTIWRTIQWIPLGQNARHAGEPLSMYLAWSSAEECRIFEG